MIHTSAVPYEGDHYVEGSGGLGPAGEAQAEGERGRARERASEADELDAGPFGEECEGRVAFDAQHVSLR